MPPPPLPRGICETHAREVKPLDHGLDLPRRRFVYLGGRGGVSCSLEKVWNLELNFESPITNPEKILSIEIFITVFEEKRTFIKDWIVFAFNTKIRSTFVNQKKFRRILFTQQALSIGSRLSQPSLFSLRITLQSEYEMNRTIDLSSYKG